LPRNIAIGIDAMKSNTSGFDNVANGVVAMLSNTTGQLNVAEGFSALADNTTGSGNVANGWVALANNISGNSNTGNGSLSLFNNLSGNGNVGDGDSALVSNTTGSFNTGIGTFSDVSLGTLTNATAIGHGAIVNASNKVRIGNSAVTVIEGQVPFTTPSDGRYKFNVQENVKGLDFILKLRPVTYQFDVQRFDAQLARRSGQNSHAIPTAYDEATRIRRSGFIAQEVEKAADASGYDFSGIIKPKTDQDHYSLSYESFVIPLVKAIQEQQQMIASLQKEVEELKKLVQSSK
jgi:trimeric autotransporter adhesin